MSIKILSTLLPPKTNHRKKKKTKSYFNKTDKFAKNVFMKKKSTSQKN